MIFIVILMNIKNAKQFSSFEKYAQKCRFVDKALVKTAAASEKVTIENENMKNK